MVININKQISYATNVNLCVVAFDKQKKTNIVHCPVCQPNYVNYFTPKQSKQTNEILSLALLKKITLFLVHEMNFEYECEKQKIANKLTLIAANPIILTVFLL